tara:strand:- start:253 stop:600 length:348 start_codon:yes stop_codon:yes gene_type:complete
MKKIVILLIILSSLFGQNRQFHLAQYKVDESLNYKLKIYDETYLKHLPNQYKWRVESQQRFIFKMREIVTDIKVGRYPSYKSKEIVDVIGKYVELEKKYKEESKLLRKEFSELTK